MQSKHSVNVSDTATTTIITTPSNVLICTIYSVFNRYLVSSYYVPGTVLHGRYIIVDKSDLANKQIDVVNIVNSVIC